ncbi:MAG: isochorismatase family protein, partial [Solirubrobacterales bacterium]|nr:isochorismatase family protein [Solirubrobacterales bacterium]
MSLAQGPGPPVTAARLDPERAVLLVVDVQEAFRKAIPDFKAIAAGAATMVAGAQAIGIPIIVTEQYPRGLGATVAEVRDHLPEGVEPIAKTKFSAAAADGFDLGGRDQVIVCGVESHVCVSQSVHDLLERGRTVHVLADAIGSRSEANRALGLARMERAGAWPSSVEAALFELL